MTEAVSNDLATGHRLVGTTLRERTAEATQNVRLRTALARATGRFGDHRRAALDSLEDPDALRLAARAIKADVIAHLPELLEQFAANVVARGGQVFWAGDGSEANAYITSVAQRIGARTVVKSKSMATEETELNEALEAIGCHVVETDLGEWIIQLAHHKPSHIIAPAVHLDRYQVAEFLQAEVTDDRVLEAAPGPLAAFAREQLRAEFLRADLGISGCNFGVAETGSVVLVTNEGNGRLCTSVPRVHIAVMGMERLLADWDQLDLFINLLARSASGQHLSSYTNIITGPRREGEADGPDEMHVVILDNGRSDIIGTELQEILSCIRCGACLNVCPVYRQIGGHAYGWVYSGPVGAVLTPLLAGEHPEAAELSNASTLCGACMDACPVSIPLQDLLLALRRRRAADASRSERAAWKAWATAWSNPKAFRASMKVASTGRGLGRFAERAPGLSRWTAGREAPMPAKRTFHERWRAGEI
ncbi:MAG TPA: LutB/LldF family L-lactate oxidation iron-sulfur protein [Acidimicrobiales bacterium]|nr:LutB/LldF family L-lactate oxidation iron-sulfur protein [Acidimicrobiales bacterium]